MRSGSHDPALRGAGFCSEESILRQDACCQELSDQPYHLLIGDAGAQPIEKQMMVDVVEGSYYTLPTSTTSRVQ